MKTRLAATECRPFFEYFLVKICEVGLMEPLRQFAESNQDSLGNAIRSWYEALVGGSSLQDSIRSMSPGFPPSIEELLVLSVERGGLDHVLADMIEVLDHNDAEESILVEMGLLLDRYRDEADSELIGEGCLEREIDKIIRRATLEGASEVILRQEGERFFHQTYVGVKPVHTTEPCHSKVYKALLRRLRESVAEHSELVVSGRRYSVGRAGEGRFTLAGPDIRLILTLR